MAAEHDKQQTEIKTGAAIKGLTRHERKFVLAGMLVMSGLLALVVTAVNLLAFAVQLRDAKFHREELFDTFLDNVSHDLSRYDLSSIEITTRYHYERGAFEGIEIIDKYGNILLQIGSDSAQTRSWREIELAHGSSGVIGHLRLFATPTDTITSGHILRILLPGLGAFLIGLVPGMLIFRRYASRYLVGPIDRLENAFALSVASGKRLLVEDEFEGRLGNLAQAFNIMQQKLQSQEQDKSLAYAELEREQLVLSEVLNSSQTGVALFSTDGHLQFVKGEDIRTVMALCGHTGGNKFEDFNETLRRFAPRSVRTGHSTSYEMASVDTEGAPTGDDRHFSLRITELKDHASIIHNEISELRQTERKLQEAHKFETIGKLSASFAHDFNNLMSSILNGAECISIAEDPLSVTRELDLIYEAIERGKTLTNHLLVYSRQVALSEERRHVGELLSNLLPFLSRSTGANYLFSINGDLDHEISIDSNLLENALLNIVLNSKSAMPNGGPITIDVSSSREDENQYVVIAIEDEGGGIPQDIISQVRDPFFSTKPKGQGTGLGLSMVDGFVQQSGGKLLIRNTLKGTRIEMYFLSLSNGPRAEPRKREYVPKPPLQKSGTACRALHLDDDPLILDTISGILGAWSIEVTSTSSFTEFRDALTASNSWDVFIVDRIMPEISGVDIVRYVRENGWTLPVIVLTGSDSAQIRAEFRDCSNTDIVAKPITGAHLSKRIFTLISQSAAM